jgi:nucleotide-binding universal stress UspA family protein
MYHLVLVPLDGSHFAEQALPWAQSIAKRAGALIQLVHVHRPMELEYPEHQFLSEDSLATEFKTRHRDYLDRLATRLRAAGANLSDPLVLHGDVAGAIHQFVADKNVDLVVMTTHARGPVARMWLGSVADQFIRELASPLFLIHPSDTKADLSDEMTLKHILVPLDGTQLAEQIIEPAVALGEFMGTEYTLVRVIKPIVPMHYPSSGAVIGDSAEDIRQQVQRIETESRCKAVEYLHSVAERLRSRLLRVHTKVVDDAHQAEAIVEAATRIPADLIAMQTHGRNGLARMLLGSVADKVLRSATTPLFIQRPAAPRFISSPK